MNALKDVKSELREAIEWHETYMGACPEWVKLIGESHPEAVIGYTKLRKAVYEEGRLTRKVKQLILLGINLTRNYKAGIDLHMKLAMDLGATREEIAETILTATLSSAAPAHHEGGIALAKQLEKHAKE